MRILLVSAEYPPAQGGVGDCTHEIARALHLHGDEIGVLTSSRKAQLPENECADQWSLWPTVTQWGWSCFGQILDRVDRWQPDILHIQYQTAAYGLHPAINLLPMRLRLRANRPGVVTTFHDLRVPYLFPKAGRARRWANLALARWSDASIVTNEEDYRTLNLAAASATLRLIRIGSNIRPRKSSGFNRSVFRHTLGVGDDELLACYFGFLNQSKGGETLVRTLAELTNRGQKAKLLMIGGQVGDSDPTNKTYLARIESLATSLGVVEQMIWTGFVPAEHVSACFAASDVCLLPYGDGISFRRGSLMAALAHGVPVVSTFPSIPLADLIDGQNVLLIPLDDYHCAANALENIWRDPHLREQLAQGALQLAKLYTWDKIVAQTSELYELLTSRAGG